MLRHARHGDHGRLVARGLRSDAAKAVKLCLFYFSSFSRGENLMLLNGILGDVSSATQSKEVGDKYVADAAEVYRVRFFFFFIFISWL